MKKQNGKRQIIGVSEHIKDIYKKITDIAKNDLTVLIQGPTGTGKELIANNIHYSSDRKNKRFVAVNCGGFSEALLESELFGHVKGAFTDAYCDKKSQLELANGGTLFLDEVGEMSPSFQKKLLRVSEEKKFEKVGGTETITTDVRFICATNKDLKALIKEQKFREDLYYRIAQYNIYTEPLSNRPEDIIRLVHHFTGIKDSKVDSKKKFLLYSYNFPGNVRELENLLNHGCEYIKQELKKIIAKETRIDYEEISKLSYDEIGEYTFKQDVKTEEEDKSLHDNLAILEALLLVDDISLDIKKIVEAYEIIVLIHRGKLDKTAIAKEILHIRRAKTTPSGFKEAFDFDLPQKGFDENLEDPNRVYRIYPHFFGYWKEQKKLFLQHEGLSEIFKKLSHRFLE